MSPERTELHRLESEGGFVFHGSGEELDILEPHQAHSVKEGKSLEDGPPAVFATPAADYAVFMAVFSKKNCPLGRHTRISALSFADGKYRLTLQASNNALSQIDDRSSGWVYVFRKSDFVEREPNSIEYINRKPVRPLKKLRVTRADIQSRIEPLG